MRPESDSEWEDDPTMIARKRRMVARSSKGRNDEELSPQHKRRKQQLHVPLDQNRFYATEPAESTPNETWSSSSSSSGAAEDSLLALPGVKKFSRYEPELPDEELAHWSKEELSEWRKKARKVRNRESAAASRRKTRDRIQELEAEVQGLKNKYQEALDRIKALTASHQPRNEEQVETAAPTTHVVVSPPASVSPDLSSVTRSPPPAPHGESWSLNGEHAFYGQDGVLDSLGHHQHHFQHLISRPTAVCV